MRTPRFAIAFCLGLFAALQVSGCSSTRQIQTDPPEPAVPSDTAETAERRAPLTVLVERGGSALPEAVQTLRFRVAEVWLKSDGAAWTRYPADVNQVELSAGEPLRKTVLSTQMPPAAYDSLGLVLSDVYVQYDANAGGPLTMPRGEPLKMGIDLRPQVGRPTVLRLTFEPGASLSRGEDCRWHFLPFVTPDVE